MKISIKIPTFIMCLVCACFFSATIGHAATDDALLQKAEAGNPAAQASLAHSYFILGMEENGEKSLQEAVKWFEKAASVGYPEALGSAGRLLFR